MTEDQVPDKPEKNQEAVTLDVHDSNVGAESELTEDNNG